MKNPHLTHRVIFKWASQHDALLGFGIDLWPKWDARYSVGRVPVVFGADVWIRRLDFNLIVCTVSLYWTNKI